MFRDSATAAEFVLRVTYHHAVFLSGTSNFLDAKSPFQMKRKIPSDNKSPVGTGNKTSPGL